jgi:hypothetical protein
LDSGKAAERAVPAPNTFSQEWANYIAARIKRAGDHTPRIAMETVGQVLAEKRDKLRAVFRCELEREVGESRRVPRSAHRACPAETQRRRH